MSSFADIKLNARRAVHKALAVPCFYTSVNGGARLAISARLHDKRVVGGDIGGGYATIIEGVTRAIFNREELISAGITLRKRDRITFPDYTLSFELDVRDAFDGPVDEQWSVAPLP